MTTETIKMDLVTVADLIAALEKVRDKTSRLTISGEAGGCHSCTPEQFDRQIHSIEINEWGGYDGIVELKI